MSLGGKLEGREGCGKERRRGGDNGNQKKIRPNLKMLTHVF